MKREFKQCRRNREIRGQSSLEFIILIGFVIIIFLGFAAVIESRIVEQQTTNKQKLLVQLADKIEHELLLAEQVRAGYGREFELPRTLGAQPYNITLEGDDTLIITSGEEEYIRFLSVNVTLYPPSTPRLLVNASVNPPRIIIRKNKWGHLFINRTCAVKGLTYKTCPVNENPS